MPHFQSKEDSGITADSSSLTQIESHILGSYSALQRINKQ